VDGQEPDPVLEDVVLDYWRACLDEGVPTAVLDERMRALEQFVVPLLGHCRISELGTDEVSAFRRVLELQIGEGGLQRGTVAVATRSLHEVLALGRRSLSVKPPPLPRRRRRWTFVLFSCAVGLSMLALPSWWLIGALLTVGLVVARRHRHT
jgi:hypothetical protein